MVLAIFVYHVSSYDTRRHDFKKIERYRVSWICIISFISYYVVSKIPFAENHTNVLYFIFFLFGYCVATLKSDSKFTKIISHYCKGISCVLCVVVCFVISTYGRINIPDKGYALLFTVLLFVLSEAMSYRLEEHSIRSLLCRVGMNTLPIYGIHWCLCFSRPYALNLYTNFCVNQSFWFRVMVVSSFWLVICYILIGVFDKSKITRVLFLGKKS